MALLEILHGPNEDQLLSALRNRRHSHQLYFRVRPEGIQSEFRLYVFIDGLEYELDLENVWRVAAWHARRGEKLIGRYSPRTRKGTLAHGTDDTAAATSIAVLGFEHEIEEMLYKAGIKSVAELIAKDEITICNILLEDNMGMSNELVRRAIQRFELVRGRMDALMYSFAGERRSLMELYCAF